MPEQIENRMLVEAEWDYVESISRLNAERRSRRRLQQIMDEMEYGKMEEEDERLRRV